MLTQPVDGSIFTKPVTFFTPYQHILDQILQRSHILLPVKLGS